MDDLVLRAMQRWPDVPAVHGWLRLDRRGRWMLIDRGQPGFDELLHGAGSPITNEQIVAFIGRNYMCNEQGSWYWQNGPQRAFVDLDLAPFVLRVFGSGRDARLVTHTGLPVAQVLAVMAGCAGDLFVLTEHGVGAMYDLDLPQLEIVFGDTQALRLWIEGAQHPIETLVGETPEGYQRRPRAENGQA